MNPFCIAKYSSPVWVEPCLKKVGTFVVGIPTKAVEEYHQKHPTGTLDATFRDLLSVNEIQQMERILQIPNVSDRKNYPFHGEPQTDLRHRKNISVSEIDTYKSAKTIWHYIFARLTG